MLYRNSRIFLISSAILFASVAVVGISIKKDDRVCNMVPNNFVKTIDDIANSPSQQSSDQIYNDLPEEQQTCIKEYFVAKRTKRNQQAKEEYHAETIAKPAAQAAIATFDVNPDNITGVSWMKPGGNLEHIPPIETVHVYGGPDYYYLPETAEILSSPPEGIPEGYIVDNEEASPWPDNVELAF